MKRLVKVLFSLCLLFTLSFGLIVNASENDFEELDVVKESTLVTDQELDCGVKLNQNLK